MPVYLINDLNKAWKGEITIELTEYNKLITTQTISHTAAAFKVDVENFKINIPAKSANYTLTARIVYNGEFVESVRDILVK